VNLTNTMRVIARHKILLIVGVLIAAAAAYVTAIKVESTWEPRAETTYRASTQILVADPTSVYSTRGTPQTLIDGQNPPAARDLSALTVVYAYVVSGPEITSAVEAQVGPLGKDDSLAGEQRTTQPGSPTNTGTYRLPILDVIGEATSPARAEAISRTAAATFQAVALAQQDAAALPPDQRVQFQVVREVDAVPVDGTNPALPIIAVGLGVLLAFIALIFAVDNARASRGQHPSRAPAPATGTVRTPVPPRPATVMANSPRPSTPGEESIGHR